MGGGWGWGVVLINVGGLNGVGCSSGGKSVRSWCDGSLDRSLMMRWVVGSIPHGATGVTKAVVCVILSVGWCI